MRVWIVVGCAVLIVGAALWPFGRKRREPIELSLCITILSGGVLSFNVAYLP